jgi:hypothetical protein
MFGFGGALCFSCDQTEVVRQVGEDLQRALDHKNGCWNLTQKLHNRNHLQITLQILHTDATHNMFTHLRRTPRCAAHVAQWVIACVQ